MAAAKRRGPVRKFFGTLGRAFAILIFIGIITGSIVVSVMALYIFDSLEGAPVVDLSNVEVNLNNTSYIYVTDPETQEETIVKELYSGQNREWVSYDQIPEMLVNVTIAAEDKRFLEHHGVDWLRTIRSTLGYFGGSSRVQGGSTFRSGVTSSLPVRFLMTCWVMVEPPRSERCRKSSPLSSWRKTSVKSRLWKPT